MVEESEDEAQERVLKKYCEDHEGKEQIWTASERRETAVILSIIKNSDEVDDDISKLSLADLDIKFSRSRTYDLATKCNSLATLIHIGIDPLRAIETVGLFTDPQQVALDSAERIDKVLFPSDTPTEKTDDQNDDPYKKRQPDITDQPSQKSVSD